MGLYCIEKNTISKKYRKNEEGLQSTAKSLLTKLIDAE